MIKWLIIVKDNPINSLKIITNIFNQSIYECNLEVSKWLYDHYNDQLLIDNTLLMELYEFNKYAPNNGFKNTVRWIYNLSVKNDSFLELYVKNMIILNMLCWYEEYLRDFQYHKNFTLIDYMTIILWPTMCGIVYKYRKTRGYDGANTSTFGIQTR